MTTCVLCGTEPRGPWYVHRTNDRTNDICTPCVDEFRKMLLEPVLRAARTSMGTPR